MADDTTVTAQDKDEIEEGAPLIYPWYVVSVLMLAQTCSFIDRMIMGLLVGPVRQSFGISDTQYSLLAGFAFSVFYAIMGLPLARIADSKSRRALIAIGIVVWSMMTALCGLAKGFWTLFLARVGVGVGEATLSPAAYSIITDYFPKSALAKALSVYTFGVTFGSGLAYIIGGKVVTLVENMGDVTIPIVGQVHGWQITFFLVGLPGLVIAALMLTVKEPKRRGALTDTGANKSSGVPVAVLLKFLKSRKMAIGTHIIGVSIFVLVIYGINIWGPTYLIRTFDFSRGQAGWVFGIIMMVGGSMGLLTGGVLADRWYARGTKDAYTRVILMSALCMLPAVLLLGFVDNAAIGILCLAIATFFSAFQGGIAGGVLQLMTPNEMRGQVVALYFLFANLVGLGLGPTVVAAITDYVFKDDLAIAQSLSLAAAIFCPLAIAIIAFGRKSVESAIADAGNWRSD